MSCNVQIIKWAPHCEDETIKPSLGRKFDRPKQKNSTLAIDLRVSV